MPVEINGIKVKQDIDLQIRIILIRVEPWKSSVLTSTLGEFDTGGLQTTLRDIGQDTGVGCWVGQYRIQHIRGAQ